MMMLLLAATAARAASPAVAVSPGANHPSSSTNLSGTGFGASEAVDLYFDTTDEQLAITNASGAFASTPISVPATALPGVHYVTAVGRHSGLGGQAKFTVQTNWTQYQFGVQQKGWNPYENVLSTNNISGLDLAWSFASSGIASSPTISGQELFIGVGSKLYALNATSGAQLWSATLGGTAAYQGSAPAVSGGNVYIGASDGKVYAFKASTGAPAWASPYATGTSITSGLTVASGVVYAWSGQILYAINASTGSGLWNHPFTPNSLCSPSPAVTGGVIFILDCVSDLVALSTSNGAPIWSSPASAKVVAGPAVANGRVLFGDVSGNIYAFSTDAGHSIWTQNPGGTAVSGSAAVANGIVYFGTLSGPSGNVFAYDVRTGTQLWNTPVATPIGTSLSVANGVVYTAASQLLLALDAHSGNILWSYGNYAASMPTAPVIANGMAYFVDSGGLLAFALNAGNNGVYHRNPKPPAIVALHPDMSLSPWHRAKLPPLDEQ
jgi:outer membrane protein assembly factor BamB